MKTLKQNQTLGVGQKAFIRNQEVSPRPKIGDDDGVSDRAMNLIIVLFTILTVCVTVATASANDEVKYRILLRQAMLDIDRMEYDKAVVKLLEVRNNTEANANVDHLLGKCYLYGDLSSEKAVFYLNRAAEQTSTAYESWDLDETNAPVETLYLLAKAYENSEHFDMAAQFYAQFVESVENGVIDVSSRTYAILSQNAERCRLAAAAQESKSQMDVVAD